MTVIHIKARIEALKRAERAAENQDFKDLWELKRLELIKDTEDQTHDTIH